MAKNFFIWAMAQGKRSASKYYRVEVPVQQIDNAGLATGYIDTGVISQNISALSRIHSDIALHYALGGTGSLHNMRVLRELKPVMKAGEALYPPTVIYDIDDNNDFVHPFNLEAFRSMGVRGYPDARLLEPGEGLVIEDSTGKQIASWEDGEIPKGHDQPFSVEKNLYEMKVRHEIVRTAHGVTVPSTTLARYMREVIKAKDVYVFHNTIVPEHYQNYPLLRTDDSVRILWQGGHSHFIDWYPLRDAIKAICQKFPQAKFVLFGEYFDWMHDVIPDEQIEKHEWVEYDAYKLKRGLLNIDINLCPLADNLFNRCKSAIKWYEASIWDKPEATLASNVPPYSEEIVDGKTGLLYKTPEEFVQKLSLLIEDTDLRKRLATSARQWVLENRTPKATIPGLFDFYTETRAKHRRELGAPIIKKPTLEQIKKVATPLR